jgi:hypothetical protein
VEDPFPFWLGAFTLLELAGGSSRFRSSSDTRMKPWNFAQDIAKPWLLWSISSTSFLNSSSPAAKK